MNTLRELLVANGFTLISESTHSLWVDGVNQSVMIEKSHSVGVQYKITIHTKGVCTTTEYKHNLTSTKKYLIDTLGLKLDAINTNRDEEFLSIVERTCDARINQIDKMINDSLSSDFVGKAVYLTRRDEVQYIKDLIINMYKESVGISEKK